MYVCAQCLNRFRMYDEDEERHTETCPHCGSEYFDHYSDEDEHEDEDEDEDDDDDDDGDVSSGCSIILLGVVILGLMKLIFD